VTLYLFGLDGASLQSIRELAATDDFPNFATVLGTGVSANLRSVYPYVTAPAWSTLFSGVNPGKHGIFDQVRMDNGVARIPNMRHSDVPFLWDYASWAGKRVMVVGVPFVYPAPELNGVFVSGRFVHGVTCFPLDIKRSFDLSGFDYTKYYGLKYRLHRSKNEVQLSLRRMVTDLQTRLKTSLALIESGTWDLVTVVESSPDEFLHVDYQNDSMKSKMYKIIDDWLGEILTRMNKNDSLIIVSDHGFGDASRVLYLKQWLISKGYLPTKTPAHYGERRPKIKARILHFAHRVPAVGIISDYIRYRFTNIGNESKDVLPEERQNYLAPRAAPGSSVMILGTQNMVWMKYLQRFGPGGGLLEAEITNDLDELRRIGLIKNVFKSSELYHGKHSSQAPGELLIEPNDDWIVDKDMVTGGPIYRNRSTKQGRHRQEGLFIAYGAFLPKIGQTVSIYDILPTLLTSLGLPMPDFLDGKPFGSDRYKEEDYWWLHPPDLGHPKT
jgi:predicted AlkP superfamily phosphohydrolase/phosphomutase